MIDEEIVYNRLAEHVKAGGRLHIRQVMQTFDMSSERVRAAVTALYDSGETAGNWARARRHASTDDHLC